MKINAKKFAEKKNIRTFAIPFQGTHTAEIAQLVEHNLAKVGVASSSLVFRSLIEQNDSTKSPGGGMVDAPVSGTGVSNDVQVRVLFWALQNGAWLHKGNA